MKNKRTDFRIGNLVEDENGFYQIDDEHLGEEYFNTLQCWGIPLTEDWLEKFGLIKKYLENQFEEGGFDLKEDGSKWYYWVDSGVFNLEIQTNGEIWFEIYSCYKHIKYVHELQNLYFCLTGNELQTQAGGV